MTCPVSNRDSSAGGTAWGAGYDLRASQRKQSADERTRFAADTRCTTATVLNSGRQYLPVRSSVSVEMQACLHYQ